MDNYAVTGMNVRIIGRVLRIAHTTWLGWSGSGIAFKTSASEVTADLVSITNSGSYADYAYLGLVLNDDIEHMQKIRVDRGTHTIELLHNPELHETKVQLLKLSESRNDKIGIAMIHADSPILPTRAKERKILFIGDSVTAGYGVDIEDDGAYSFSTRDENVLHSYAAMTARALDADFQIVAGSGKGVISNSIDPSTDLPDTEGLIPALYPYVDRHAEEIIKIYLSAHGQNENARDLTVYDPGFFVPDVIVTFLGTNDSFFTKGIPTRMQHFTQRYSELLRALGRDYPGAQRLVIYGTMEQSLSEACYQAAGLSNSQYLQLPLQDPADGFGGGMHPSLRTQEKLAEAVTTRIRQMMDWQ